MGRNQLSTALLCQEPDQHYPKASAGSVIYWAEIASFVIQLGKVLFALNRTEQSIVASKHSMYHTS